MVSLGCKSLRGQTRFNMCGWRCSDRKAPHPTGDGPRARTKEKMMLVWV